MMTDEITAESPVAHVARAWAELGADVSYSDAEEILRRLGPRAAELYATALHCSVASKRRREMRREARAEWAASR